MRQWLDQLIEPAQRINQRIAPMGDERLTAAASVDMTRLVARIAATLGFLDSLVNQADDRIVKTQAAWKAAYTKAT